MSEIVEFLHARLDADGNRAQQIEGLAVARFGGVPQYRNLADTPVRIGREVEAKRQILDDHIDAEGQCLRCLDSDGVWEEDGKVIAYTQPYPCMTVRALASVYSDHPDFREEWAI
ncbi:DUF6221 family protein [Prescottella agglutinans]|uniref:Uncharacterized protein n=1 Tax=Prescottella agglutinans TaxID=1644129 RepID=A0ABT6MHK2_9NOCA|nr:DUF6221 family protein [Prescottella agglutinans]MDH6282834.1 hypothetical protein [Prescottella agglutinans]